MLRIFSAIEHECGDLPLALLSMPFHIITNYVLKMIKQMFHNVPKLLLVVFHDVPLDKPKKSNNCD